ncbi:MAG TPA: histidine kinase [Steroidobacteraceae bacterium]|nr:histidine kinase [Steroidobacteraceae bacterium]
MQEPASRSLAQAAPALERRSAARRDLVVVLAISLGAALLCAKLNLSELMLGWARPHERWQLDELPGVLLAIAICLIWFSTRRYAEARRELVRRRAAEARLAEALAENQRLAQQYLDRQESERRALARDLHDELGQYINAIKLDALALREAVAAVHGAGERSAAAMIDNIDRVYAVVGGLIRQLRPVGLDELGLVAALEHCMNEWRQRLPSMRIVLTIESDLGPLDPILSLTLFRLIQEAMTNIARHAQASRVEVRLGKARLEDGRDGIEAMVADDGRGADLGAPHQGLGLIGMRERAAALGGSLAISSVGGAGGGFTVRAIFPATPAAPDT